MRQGHQDHPSQRLAYGWLSAGGSLAARRELADAHWKPSLCLPTCPEPRGPGPRTQPQVTSRHCHLTLDSLPGPPAPKGQGQALGTYRLQASQGGGHLQTWLPLGPRGAPATQGQTARSMSHPAAAASGRRPGRPGNWKAHRNPLPMPPRVSFYPEGLPRPERSPILTCPPAGSLLTPFAS